jgi:protein-S-isoprenylcysteine O-methyltransferase Ste14
MHSNQAQQEHKQQQHKQTMPQLRTVTKLYTVSALFMLLLLAPSGDWTWPAAWFLFVAPLVLVSVPCLLYLRAYNPDLITERQKFLRNEGTANFEWYLVPAAIGSIPLRLLAAGWQHRWQLQQPGWTPTPFLSTWMQIAAAAVVILALAFQSWSMCANKYFSSVVRIQTDRGHKVCSQGPYAFVRHPGYVGFGLQGVAESALLQSSWGMMLALWLVAVLVVRTVYEDSFLQSSLPGYAAYTKRVKYRWVPLLW